MKKDNIAIFIAALIVLVFGGVALAFTMRGGSESDMATQGSTMTDDASGLPAIDAANETQTVEIKNFAFGPQAIKVRAGTKVTWTNQDTVKHNAVKDDGQADGPDGPLLSKGESYSYTYDTPGTYTYHCAPHTSMKGVVYVTE